MLKESEGRRRTAGIKRKKRLKKSVKITLGVLVLICAIAGYLYLNYYMSTHSQMGYGEVDDAVVESDQTLIDDELGKETTSLTAKYTILDVEGEAILIQIGNTDCLIDTGSEASASKLVQALHDKVKGNLEYVILTSEDPGRTGGIKALYKDKQLKIENTIVGELGSSRKLIDELADKSSVTEGESSTIELEGNATLSIFKPEISTADVKNKSLMVGFTHGDTKFLSLSDAGIEEEAKLIGIYDKVDVLVLGRYGSNKSNNVVFNERYAVASIKDASAIANEVLLRHSNVFATGKSGEIVFTSDSALVTTEVKSSDVVKPKE